MTPAELVAAAFAEDLPGIDVTTDHLQIKEKIGYAFLVAKADIKLSGTELFEQSIRHLAPTANLKWYFHDGDTVLKTQKICSIYGNLLPVLKAERVALNFLGYLSGIATLTHQFVNASRSERLQILDTRKTTPLYRYWAKKAVRDGGGTNHRIGLSDAVLIKENHIRIAGSITQAVEQIRRQWTQGIEVEVTTLEEVREALACGVERLLFDNMSNETLAQALALVPDNVKTEASGNMSVARVTELSQFARLDFISVGALTHSAPTADISLLFDF